MHDYWNAKEHYQWFIRKEFTKSAKQSDIITDQPKIFENWNIVDIKSVITEHSKTAHKISKTTREVETVGSNSSLCKERKKNRKSKKYIKTKKRAHAFKGFASS